MQSPGSSPRFPRLLPCGKETHVLGTLVHFLFVGSELGVCVSIHSLLFPEHSFPDHRHTCRKRSCFDTDTDTDTQTCTNTRKQTHCSLFPGHPSCPPSNSGTNNATPPHPCSPVFALLYTFSLSWTRTHTPFRVAGRQIRAFPTVLESDL
jgi:hypothetical protein